MTDQAISPLRRRMIEDMTIRKLGAKTRAGFRARCASEVAPIRWTGIRVS
jgi:hypothetical protein